MLHCSPQRCFPAALSTPGKSCTPSLQPGSMPASLATKPDEPSASPISWTKHFPRASSLWEWLLQPLLCWTMQHPQAGGPRLCPAEGSQPGLSPCSFWCCKISPSLLLYFELMTVCPLSTSTLFPGGNWSVILFWRTGTWAVTPYGVYVWHPISACLKVSPSFQLPAHSHPGLKNLSASFHPSSGDSG